MMSSCMVGRFPVPRSLRFQCNLRFRGRKNQRERISEEEKTEKVSDEEEKRKERGEREEEKSCASVQGHCMIDNVTENEGTKKS